jgi:hypothetical protein
MLAFKGKTSESVVDNELSKRLHHFFEILTELIAAAAALALAGETFHFGK